MARKQARSTNLRVFSASSQPSGRKARREGGSGLGPGSKSNPAEAYTFLPSLPKRHRTSAAQLSLTREELESSEPSRRSRYNDDEDEDEDMGTRIRKLAVMIAADDGGQVEDGDDEDVDSDEAWEEDGSDEERWGDVFRNLDRGNKKKQVKPVREVARKPERPLNVNLDESDSDPEEERSSVTAVRSAFRDEKIATEEVAEEEEEEEGGNDDDDDDSDEEDEEEEEYDEEPELPSDLSEDDDDAAFDDLDAFVHQLAATDKKRKVEVGGESGPVTANGKKRRVLPVVAAPGIAEDSDLALQSKQKVDFSSLISSHPSLSSASALLSSKADKKATSILKSGVLPAPLPTVVQERLDREAAYEKTREEGQKWSGVMKRVKEAEHLSFPLQATARGGVKSAGEVVAAFKPENEHESAVQALLARANLTDAGVTAAEDAALRGQDLSIEEIAARRQELRHQRELMFRAEARAKRVAKIKSKTFRKLARKREAKASAADGDQGISLEDLERLNPEAASEERDRLERERARERATLRHGARSGRWARDVGGDGGEIEDRRHAKEEMLDIRDRLQRKIHGNASEEDSSASDESDADEDDDEDAIKTRAFDQLAALNVSSADAQPKKGLMQMAFMRKAEEREMKRAAQDEADLRRDLEQFGADGEDEGGINVEDAETAAQVLKIGEGRMVFSGPVGSSASTSARPPAVPVTDEVRRSPTPPLTGAFGDVNPWLDSSTASGPSRKRNTLVNSSEARAVRAIKKAGKEKNPEPDDGRVEISVNGVTSSRQSKMAGIQAQNDSDDESNDNADDLMPVTGMKAFMQRDLVAEAFAGDNVVEDFATEKQRAIEADAPKVEDTTIPGWGSWGGKGVRKRAANPRFLKTTPGIAPEERKDAAHGNVIISEKKDRKAAQFLAKDLPYPYTSVAQYEASFRNPVGSEWNSRAGFQRSTIPRVVKKPGAIIEPIRKLF